MGMITDIIDPTSDITGSGYVFIVILVEIGLVVIVLSVQFLAGGKVFTLPPVRGGISLSMLLGVLCVSRGLVLLG